LIGAAASGLLLLDGKIAGISGILGNALVGARDAWRWAFLAGMLVAAAMAQAASLPEVPPLFTEPRCSTWSAAFWSVSARVSDRDAQAGMGSAACQIFLAVRSPRRFCS
jgi:hypothetical protein